MSELNAQLAWRNALNKSIDDLQENIRTKNPTGYGPMNNTGKAANSLQYRWVSKEHAQVFSSMPDKRFNYIWTLEYGRKPGKQPPSSAILEWVKQRNLGSGESEQKSIAFLIARKIGAQGSALFRKGGGSGIISDVANKKYINDNFYKPLEDMIRDNLKNELGKI